MDTLNFVNLIQAATIGVGVMGSLLLWRIVDFRGISLLLCLTAFAACINILEESGITRDLYLISPVFIMLFGPATYLASKQVVEGKFEKSNWLHFIPIVPMLFFTSNVQVVISLGTIWRLVYAYLTASLLLKYKRTMDDERSDSDEFSLNWLMWVVICTALFNFIDLLRLNTQHIIPYELNVFGQGVNNFVWLAAVMVITYKLLEQGKLPKREKKNVMAESYKNSTVGDYRSIFEELDKLIISNKWFLKPRLTLLNLSELTGLQTREISRAINLVTEKSFNEYINRYRIEYVCQALEREMSQSLTSIFSDAGFSSKASFNKVFKQMKGVTPTEYKARKQV